MPRVALHTLGCKLNFAETSTIGQQFLERGFEIVDLGEPADVCVINTCSVTARAARECRQLIRRALRTGGDPVIVVTGCYAQLEPEEIASISGVDLVLGTREKFALFDYLPNLQKSPAPRVHVSNINTVGDFGPAFSTDAGNRTRAFLKVQDGCDYTCSFCTIPLARGESRSQSIAATLAQARNLVMQGYKEIVLTGVNVGDYGRKTGDSLVELLHELAGVSGLQRLRISSLEPNLVSDRLIDFIAFNAVMCKHFHVPLQSGCDAVLRLMRRRYTTSEYSALVRKIRTRIPDAGIGVDVIVGFPGETDVHFDQTYRFLSELEISYLHVFTYSERPNTPAASFAGAVHPAVRHKRNEMLRILSEKKRQAFNERMVGRTVGVLMESDVENGYRFGFTDNYIRVATPAEHARENTIVRLLLERSSDCFSIGSPAGVGYPA
jgi:threonylcarbamoyladenosine tRNA methylthiotransferase MtaB